MKKLLITMMALGMLGTLRAQFSKATLQANGVTCALCSNAINKALQKVSFVESVKPDIKNSAFAIVFRPNATVDIDVLKNAVEDAGFSVGSLKITGTFSELKVANDAHVRIGSGEFHFLNVNDQTLNGEKTLTVLDKNFVSDKEFRKISSLTKKACLQTGKSAACCVKEGIPANTRIYHVTI